MLNKIKKKYRKQKKKKHLYICKATKPNKIICMRHQRRHRHRRHRHRCHRRILAGVTALKKSRQKRRITVRGVGHK